MDIDVLVVGAGPTGLMLACQLARRSLRVLIIDRHRGPSLQTRALGVQARTLEIYAKLGIAERALDLGKRGTGANIWAEQRHMARVPLGDAGKDLTPYPFILILGQDDNERLMGEKLRELGQSVAWNTELVGLTQDADKVTATLKLPDATTRTITAAWVAGCDGAHSAVRELNGITFPGAPYEHVFFIADVEASGNMIADEVNVYLFRAGFHLLFPMRGKDHWRVVGILPPDLRDRSDLTFDALIPRLRREAVTGLSFRSCSWFSTYRIHHRSAAQFRHRRCFLLGDAAHIHSPVGAQGMNTGLQDAYNLAWKLALVIKGEAGAGLLDSYQEERMPVAQRLLATTDRAFRLVISESPMAGLLRTQVLARIAAFALSLRWLQRYAFRTVSQIAINYRHSSLSETAETLPATAPRGGDRFPWLNGMGDFFRKLDDTEFNLILFGQTLPGAAVPGLESVCRIHSIPADLANDAELAKAGIPAISFYLLRPDGHVGLCGTRFDAGAVRRYFSQRLCFGSQDEFRPSEPRRQ